MPRTQDKSDARRSRMAPPTLLPSYWERSQWPLQGLLFLLPLLVIYEIGMVYHGGATGQSRYIFARSLLRDFFEILGVTGYYLPGLIVVVVLLAMHFARRDRFHFELKLYWLMWTESLALAMPLFVFMLVLFREPASAALQAGGGAAAMQWQQNMLSAIGAGIYEELLFRLIAIAVLHMLFADLLALPRQWSAGLAILISAIAFALYHFSDENPFHWGKCLFYIGAGIYLAGVYVLRGFGIVAATHALYDVLVAVLILMNDNK